MLKTIVIHAENEAQSLESRPHRINGLNYVYKRFRRDWGISKVKNDSVGRERDKRVVLNFASSFSNRILSSIEFVHWGYLPEAGMITPSCQ
jgi:hypothetical protein